MLENINIGKCRFIDALKHIKENNDLEFISFYLEHYENDIQFGFYHLHMFEDEDEGLMPLIKCTDIVMFTDYDWEEIYDLEDLPSAAKEMKYVQHISGGVFDEMTPLMPEHALKKLLPYLPSPEVENNEQKSLFLAAAIGGMIQEWSFVSNEGLVVSTNT